ncbi:MAG: glutathione S-transferase N-terminal domain-containing protein [Proteobacteria bacterium]|nr:glutathione S-transferase N-terminal domain-containing protein [Pseudomonadota bacterium]
MIDLYTWPTPNGHKIHIMLEETGLAYNVIPVDIGAGDQFDPAFLKISPNNKMPAMVDPEGPGGKPIALSESGAMLIYLADKTGQFLPEEPHARYATLQWLMFQMGHIGPMLGQVHHFRNYALEKLDYAIERYENEANRLYRVLDKRLGEVPYVVGEAYTIADMAIFPWVRRPENQGVEASEYPNYLRWRESIAARPAVQRGVDVLADRRREGPMSEKAREVMFGASQYQRR